MYDSTKPATQDDIVFVSKSYLGFQYNNDTKSIETYPLESGERDIHQMKIFKGIPNEIKIEVNEMNENLVHGNGLKDS